jgi:hypothetical protein
MSLLLLGCGEVLGIPTEPYLLQPDAAVNGVESTAPDTESGGDPTNPEATASPDGGARSNGVAGDGNDGGEGAAGPPSNEIIRQSSSETITIGGRSTPSACAPLSRAIISDFTFLPDSSPTNVVFGVDAAFAGGTYFYPDGAALSSDVTNDTWHLSGMVTTTSGFGLFSSGCSPLDASAFVGISFTLSGSIEADRRLIFFVESAAQQISYLWQNAQEPGPTEPDAAPNAGRCMPATSRYDGTCREPRVLLEVPPLPTTVEIAWADLLGGSPVASVDPTEITAIAWALPEPAASAYAVDIHIDDLRFIAP